MNRTLVVFLICFGLLPSLLFAAGDDILFKVDDAGIKVSEFEYIYNKNNFNNKADYSEASLREYLELYINFRLKVKEAEAMGLHEDPKLISELRVYQQQLYNSYYDRNALKKLQDEVVERLNHDVSVSHVYCTTKDKKGNDISVEARKKIEAAQTDLKRGTAFEDVAKKYSDDGHSRSKGGLLGYFTGLQIAFYDLENAAYNVPVGSYSEIIETAIGYHIVKVNDKRDAYGKVKVAIIKLRKKETELENNAIADFAKKLHGQLKEGASFEEIASKNSDDLSTREKGGELDWFGISQYDPKFEAEVFKLKNVGDISEAVEINKSWYIIKLLGQKKGIETPQDLENLSNEIKESERYKELRKSHVAKILNTYGYTEKPAFQSFKTHVMGHFQNANTSFDHMANEEVILEIAGTEYTNKNFTDYLTKNAFKYRRLSNETRFDRLLFEFKEEKALDFHIQEYGKENLEYGALLGEYRDGILLFDLMERKVWSKAVQDTSGLKDYFERHETEFKNPEQASARKFSVADTKAAKFLTKALTANPKLDSKSWRSKLDKKGISADFEELIITKDDNLVKKLGWTNGSVNTITDDGSISIIQLVDIEPETQRAFKDSKGFAIAGYQEYLEKQWITELHEKYSVKVDEEILKSLIK